MAWRGRLLTIVGVGALSAGLLGACGGASGPKTVSVGQAENNGSVSLSSGDVLQVSLPANATTGFSWETVEHGSLTPAGSRYVPTPHRPGLVGSGGTAIFEFRATSPGAQHLKLTYAQHFDQSTPPAKVYSLTVDVSG